MSCSTCLRPIEAESTYCRHCGARQVARGGRQPAGWEAALRRAFPRHSLQDDLMHIGQIAAGAMALLGLIIGVFFLPAVGLIFIVFAIAVLLQLLVRERTLDHVRDLSRGGLPPGRYHAGRTEVGGQAASPRGVSPKDPTRSEPPAPGG